jgi:uroporphyrinogen III methyltransferase/synthase
MPGTVYLVGAGPGDPGLLTRRGLELLEEADVVVYDRLVNLRLISEARSDAELVYAGKQPGEGAAAQANTNALIVERARQGKLVVRLKGGDPLVFGRGGEEAEALVEAGVPFEIVPGVTAGVAAPAYAGIPVTHRDQASAVAFVTGHEDPGKQSSAIDWSALAAFPGTLVFYMGVRSLGEIADRLIEHGRPAGEPAAVIERGSLPTQRAVSGSLAEIAERATEEGIEPPAVTVVGPVAALRERLAWFELAPLHGKRVVVTRARAQASELAERLRRLGAEPIEAPTIRIQPKLDSPEVSSAIDGLAAGEYDIVCITSPNGAELLCNALDQHGLDARALAGATLAAIGPGTAEALARGGLRADVVPERSIAEALADELRKGGLDGKRVLVARAAEARDVLPKSLTEAGARVDVVALYDTVPQQLPAERLAEVANADYVTFTSSSTVRYFLEALGGSDRLPPSARFVSIGPITSEAARAHGIEVHAEADRHDIDGLVQALVDDVDSARTT